MKKGMLLFVILSFLALDSHGQQVSESGGKFYFSAMGMLLPIPLTNKSKPRTTNATNSTMGSNTLTNISSAVNNEKISYEFEIAASDNATNLSWLAAVNLCAGLSGGNWRLPTQRELMIIWIMHGKLKGMSGFTSFNIHDKYWSASEYTNTWAWYVDFVNGCTDALEKTLTTKYRARCIRDLKD